MRTKEAPPYFKREQSRIKKLVLEKYCDHKSAQHVVNVRYRLENLDPLHEKMQARLMFELREEYGAENVCREQDFVDVRVETAKELIFFEIKSDLDPRAVILQALGQILEYAYHPARSARQPDQLVIVGRAALRPEDRA